MSALTNNPKVWRREQVPDLLQDHEKELSQTQGPIVLDLAGVVEMDSAGAAFLALVARKAHAERRPFSLVNVAPKIADVLNLIPFTDTTTPSSGSPDSWLVCIGDSLVRAYEGALTYLSFCADLAFFIVHGLLHPTKLNWRVIIYQMSELGSRAFGIVGLISFLIGGTLALQGAAQLRQFGANIFLADLIGISVTRELGPLLTAIVIAGRSGSAVAAEMATMQVSEEIDALKTMGLHPIKLLILPKSLAISITQPLLTLFADALAIGGGLLVAAMYLDVTPVAFLQRLSQALHVKDIVTGLIKSLAFANIIVSLGAVIGLATQGGADEVGRSTTKSVVWSIFSVIVADAAFSLVFYFGG